MLCRIADLYVEVPEAGGMSPRCRFYRAQVDCEPDIVISASSYVPDNWPTLPYEEMCYLESGSNFYGHLLSHGGMMLHSSAVDLNGRAYLFSGPCGRGKSTHARLWLQEFGEAESPVIFNDDKPALKFEDGRWFAYGTPWCGKDGINDNRKVPLAGICFLERGEENVITRLPSKDAIGKILSQTLRKLRRRSDVELLMSHVGLLVEHVPVFELACRADAAAAHLCREVMEAEALKAGL